MESLKTFYKTFFKMYCFKSDHFDGSAFFNYDKKLSQKSFLDVLKWRFQSKKKPWPKEKVRDNLYPDLESLVPENGYRVTFVNHATVLVQFAGVSILTDPVLLETIAPFGIVRRYRDPGIKIQDLPPIDFVLISHNHYDHLDLPTVKELGRNHHTIFLVPLGVKCYFPREILKTNQFIEMDWWQEYKKNDLRITFVPAQHWSKRGIFDTNKSLWGGFIIQHREQTIFFAGDTGFGSHFNLISQKFPNIDLAMLPIGAYEPRWFMKEAHMNPEEALEAALILKATTVMGIHFGTFNFSDEGINDPEKDLALVLQNKKLDPSFFWVPKNGESHSIELFS